MRAPATSSGPSGRDRFQSSAISYLGPDGRQYIAIVGSSRPGDPLVSLDAPADAASRYRRPGSMLYVFGLTP